MTIVLCCGGRTYNNYEHTEEVLNKMLEYYKKDIIIVQGGALGADKLCRDWALTVGVPAITVHAPWPTHGKGAGHTRNQWMLDILNPNLVLAFPGGAGTADMKRRATKAGVPVYEG